MTQQQHVSRAHIVFDATCPGPFADLVKHTIAESEFITTSDADRGDRVLVVNERIPNEPLNDIEGPAACVTFHPQVNEQERIRTLPETWSYRVPLEDATDSAGFLLPDDSAESDALRDHENAPPVVQDYDGPFYITIQEDLQ